MLILLVVLIGLSVFLARRASRAEHLSEMELLWQILTFLSAGGASITLIVCLCELAFSPAAIVEFKSTADTVERLRSNASEAERATMAHDIIEANKWLAKKKYFNKWYLAGPMIPDEVDDLRPIGKVRP